MATDEVQRLVGEVGARLRQGLPVADVLPLGPVLRRLRSWLDGCDVAYASEVPAGSALPEPALAQSTLSSAREVDRVLRRGALAQQLAPFGTALAQGEVRGEHLDAWARPWPSSKPPSARPSSPRPTSSSRSRASRRPEEFRTVVTREVRRLEADDGRARLERQRRATRLRTWVDRDAGRWCLRGEFDPETGVLLHNRLVAATSTLFAEAEPATCPTEPVEKQHHLRALALVELVKGRGPAMGRPEVIAVLDTTPVTGGPIVDWGIPVELPTSVLVALCERAEVHAVVVRNGAVVYAPGTLDPGRATRVANRAQRRALRARYGTCAIPNCGVRFNDCKIHHVIWWRHYGLTDLDNLLPLCSRHHHAVHDTGWHLALRPDRVLTTTFPDGTTMTTGPPRRAAV